MQLVERTKNKTVHFALLIDAVKQKKQFFKGKNKLKELSNSVVEIASVSDKKDHISGLEQNHQRLNAHNY